MNAAVESIRGDKLINIDNGGTLTDICVIDGARVYEPRPSRRRTTFRDACSTGCPRCRGSSMVATMCPRCC